MRRAKPHTEKEMLGVDMGGSRLLLGVVQSQSKVT